MKVYQKLDKTFPHQVIFDLPATHITIFIPSRILNCDLWLKDANHDTGISIMVSRQVSVPWQPVLQKPITQVVLISGYDGGTGAAWPVPSTTPGLPWERWSGRDTSDTDYGGLRK